MKTEQKILSSTNIYMNDKPGTLSITQFDDGKYVVYLYFKDDNFQFIATEEQVNTIKNRLSECLMKDGAYVCDDSLIAFN